MKLYGGMDLHSTNGGIKLIDEEDKDSSYIEY